MPSRNCAHATLVGLAAALGAASGCGGSDSSGGMTTGPSTSGVVFQSIYTGDHHTCALTASGVAYCWGRNDGGQTGTGNLGSGAFILTPAPVVGTLRFSTLTMPSVGSNTCGLTTAGASYCWGYNSNGETGDGTTALHFTPAPTSGGNTYQALAMGNFHTCGLTGAGTIYCWGHNQYGGLGDGGTTPHLTPTLAAAAAGKTWKSISAGYEDTCALTTTGDAYCWGHGLYGELGIAGTPTSVLAPGLVSGGHTFKSLSVGYQFTCGLTTSNAAYCWGNNQGGEMGDGTTTQRNTPVAVTGGLTFQSISAGGSHACGLTAAGTAYCWGYNASGALGDGTFTDHASPHLVSGGLTFRTVSAGNGTTCGIDTGGVAYCWGSNVAGELGDGTSTYKLTPNKVQIP